MNVTSLSYPDASFDAVLDKGTLDCLLCGESSTANTAKYMSEVSRVLKPGGLFLVVTYGSPENRLSYLEGDYGWTTSVNTLPKPVINAEGLPEVQVDESQVHYVFLCRKN